MPGNEDLTARFKEESFKAAPPPPPPPPKGEEKKKKKGKKGEGLDLSKQMEQGELYTDEEKRMKMVDFYNSITEIKKKLDNISKLRGEIEKTHKESLQSATVQKSVECSNIINSLMSEVHQASQYVRKTLTAMQDETGEVAKDATPGSAFLRARVHQHDKLLRNYLSEMKKFQKMQESCSQQYKEQIKRQYKIVVPNATSEQIKAVLQDPDAQKGIFTMAVRGEAEKELKIMEERCNDMKKLEQSIIELAGLFTQLNEMLVSQRDVLAKVGANIYKVEAYSEKAKKETEAAVEQAKAYRKKKLIFVGIIAFLLLAVLIYAIVQITFIAMPRRMRMV